MKWTMAWSQWINQTLGLLYFICQSRILSKFLWECIRASPPHTGHNRRDCGTNGKVSNAIANKLTSKFCNRPFPVFGSSLFTIPATTTCNLQLIDSIVHCEQTICLRVAQCKSVQFSLPLNYICDQEAWWSRLWGVDWTVDTASMLLCHTPSHISAIVTVHTCGTGVRKENVMARVIQLHPEL